MAKALILIIVIMFAGALAYAEDEKLGRDDFVSSSIDAVIDKVDKYASGEKSFLYTGEENKNENAAGNDTDMLGRKIKEPDLKPLNTSRK